jgi:hypothetical protein
MKRSLIVTLAVVMSCVWTPVIVGETSLEYQNRGNRYEGVKPKPVSGYDIELISAIVDYKEEVVQLPERLKVQFYLKQPSKVYLTVREFDYTYYYWMDRVQPAQPWRLGFDNAFDWPTREVIQPLGHITMYDLGVVARLDKLEPSKSELVAPVIFYHSHIPTVIQGYLFTFKTSGDARLTCAVYKEGESEPLFTQSLQRQRGGRSFTVRWDSAQVGQGSYRLVLRGYFLETNMPIDQTVTFYHQPNVR